MKGICAFAAGAVAALSLATATDASADPSITHLSVPITVISIPSYICLGQPTEPIDVGGTANLIPGGPGGSPEPPQTFIQSCNTNEVATGGGFELDSAGGLQILASRPEGPLRITLERNSPQRRGT